MIQRLKQILSRNGLRLMAVACGMILLSGCVKNPSAPPDDFIGYDACWPCAVYEQVFNGMDAALKTLMSTTCSAAMTLLGLGLAFWLLFYVVKFIVSMQQPNIFKFVQPMAVVFFKAIVVAALIRNSDAYVEFVGTYLLQPILDAFLNLSNLVLDNTNFVGTAVQGAQLPADHTIFQNASLLLSDTTSGDDLRLKFLAILFKIFVGLKQGIALGFMIWTAKGISTFWLGLFVVIMFWVLVLTLPMSFTDGLVRLVTTVILSPFALVAWVFPATKDIIGKSWGILLGSGMVVFFSCVYISLVVSVLTRFTDQYYPGIMGSGTQANDPSFALEAQSLSTGILAFFVLLLGLNKLSKYIPNLANAFGGETVQSSWIKVYNGMKQLAIAAAKVTFAAAVASPSVAKSAVDDVKDVAKSAAKSAGPGGS